MSRYLGGYQREHASSRHDAELSTDLPSPGKRTLTAGVVQRKAGGGAEPAELPAASGGGAPLPGALRAKMEAAFGADFSSVRVHEGDRPAALGARAFTQGTDLHFAPGEYQPDTEQGQVLIGHELAHVVQQSQGRVAATIQAKGVGINDDAGLEREADEMGARAARGEKVSDGVTVSSSGGAIVQRKEREPGDLDYGFSDDRWDAMLHHANVAKDDHRGDVCPTVDDLNEQGGVTDRMKQFKFHELLDYIRTYAKVANPLDAKEQHVVAWVNFLKANLHRIDLKKQVDVATSLAVPAEATKDRLLKNRNSKLGAPQRVSIRTWYDTRAKPADPDELNRLFQWVWNAFFRITSKLGLEFTQAQGHAIHFNISDHAYRSALRGRDPSKAHGRNAITHSELRHLKRLQDRGKAPEVHFEDNKGGVHDVRSPMKSLDMLDAGGVARLYQTPQWTKESVEFETRLGTYLATAKPQAKQAVQAGLTKMDQVLAKNNHSHSKSQYQQHRKVFGKKDEESAGQVGEDAETIRSVIKGTPKGGDDPINVREQMTAFYNAGLWNSRRGTTIKQVLTTIGQIEDKATRKDEAAKVDISEAQIERVHAIIRGQIQATQDKIDAIAALDSGERLARAKSDLDLKEAAAQELVRDIHLLNKERRAARREGDQDLRKEKLAIHAGHKWALARKHTSLNILETDIDTDDSRPAREKRDGVDRAAHQKSAQDYATMGVPLSNREQAAIGGVADQAAKLPWVEGVAYFKIDETKGWGKEMKEKGLPTVAGNSGTAARLMNIYQWLEAGPALDFRMALMGWMLPCRDHSLVEILSGCKTAGVDGGEDLGDPVAMYRSIAPMTTAELRQHAAKDGLFPEERVLRTVDEPTYKALIKQG